MYYGVFNRIFRPPDTKRITIPLVVKVKLSPILPSVLWETKSALAEAADQHGQQNSVTTERVCVSAVQQGRQSHRRSLNIRYTHKHS